MVRLPGHTLPDDLVVSQEFGGTPDDTTPVQDRIWKINKTVPPELTKPSPIAAGFLAKLESDKLLDCILPDNSDAAATIAELRNQALGVVAEWQSCPADSAFYEVVRCVEREDQKDRFRQFQRALRCILFTSYIDL